MCFSQERSFVVNKYMKNNRYYRMLQVENKEKYVKSLVINKKNPKNIKNNHIKMEKQIKNL